MLCFFCYVFEFINFGVEFVTRVLLDAPIFVGLVHFEVFVYVVAHLVLFLLLIAPTAVAAIAFTTAALRLWHLGLSLELEPRLPLSWRLVNLIAELRNLFVPR